MSSRHFYKDTDGSVKRYYYCPQCLKGPFKDIDIKEEKLIKIGSYASPLYYCPPCYKVLFPKNAKIEDGIDQIGGPNDKS
jgi:hypothetical protein